MQKGQNSAAASTTRQDELQTLFTSMGIALEGESSRANLFKKGLLTPDKQAGISRVCDVDRKEMILRFGSNRSWLLKVDGENSEIGLFHYGDWQAYGPNINPLRLFPIRFDDSGKIPGSDALAGKIAADVVSGILSGAL